MRPHLLNLFWCGRFLCAAGSDQYMKGTAVERIFSWMGLYKEMSRDTIGWELRIRG
nr:hypothetical protein GZ26E7_11 [uncultured archaeon GZfos26E7]